MTITENHYKNIGRRHTKTIESFNTCKTPKQNLFKTILENKACEYLPKAHDLKNMARAKPWDFLLMRVLAVIGKLIDM